jgi:hypothetical protein
MTSSLGLFSYDESIDDSKQATLMTAFRMNQTKAAEISLTYTISFCFIRSMTSMNSQLKLQIQ